ncbi:MAG: Fe-S cluster assembly protein SufD [Pseudomonadota bacterium]
MSVAIMKTKAEQAFSDAYSQVAEQLPGSDDVRVLRKKAIGEFDALGLPHRRIEEWKYTDLRNQLKEALPVGISDETTLTIADVIVALGPFAHVDAHRAVIVNGRFRGELSSLQDVSGVEVRSVADALGTTSEALKSRSAPRDDAVLALNTAYVTDGVMLDIANGTTLQKPLMLVHLRAGKAAQFNAIRHVISVGDEADASIIEAFVTLPGAARDGQVNAASDVTVGDGATLHHVKLCSDTGAVTHLANWMVNLGASCTYRGFLQTQGVSLARHQVLATFNGEDAKLDLSGAFLGADQDHIDMTVVVNHDVPGCESRELFKGVLQDRARGVVQGKVVVQPIAQKTDGKQMAQVLMLSPDTEFDSKPELEIYADDVACGHGSTVAEIDADLLFYCRSRGIPDAMARVLLTESFIAEAIEQVEIEPIQDALMASAREWLETATRRT